MRPDDLPMLTGWLQTPEVRQWFAGDNFVDELRSYLDDPRVVPRIVEEDGRAVAYVHDYDVHGWDDHPLAFLPAGARGIDTFIGSPEDMRRRLGPAYLSALVDELFAAGVPAVGIDPDPDNTAAIRAYEKAGFRRHPPVVTRWGPALPMSRFAPHAPD